MFIRYFRSVEYVSSYYYISSSLPQLPFTFGLGFPHDRSPFCSGQNSCSPSFYSHSPQVHFVIIHRPLLMSSFSPSPGLPCPNFITLLTHLFEQQAQAVPIFVLSLQVQNFWRLKFIIDFFIYFYSPILIFICWPIYIYIYIYIHTHTHIYIYIKYEPLDEKADCYTDR
jgi:hypothetical protein